MWYEFFFFFRTSEVYLVIEVFLWSMPKKDLDPGKFYLSYEVKITWIDVFFSHWPKKDLDCPQKTSCTPKQLNCCWQGCFQVFVVANMVLFPYGSSRVVVLRLLDLSFCVFDCFVF